LAFAKEEVKKRHIHTGASGRRWQYGMTLVYKWGMYMGVSINGAPIAGWFIMENPSINESMDPHDLENSHQDD
jgi:hypothetical protein